MIRILFAAILLAGCNGCAQAPIVPEAQLQMSGLASSYKLAHEVERKFCTMDKLTQPCVAARTSGYNVEAAITTANGERTEATIAEARRKLISYETAVGLVL